MKLKDLKIGLQLRIGMVLIFFFVLILGVVAWYQSGSLWEQTDGLYQHPLKVRRAISELQSDILKIHRSLKDLIILNDEQKEQSLLVNMEIFDANAFKQVEIIEKAYLGPPTDVDEIRDAIAAYKPFKVEILNLLKSGRKSEAERLAVAGGRESVQVDLILKQIDDVSRFAIDRADKFYAEAQKGRSDLQQFLLFVIVIILILVLLISFLLIKNIRTPIDEMIKVTDEYRKGNLDARMEYTSDNEFGMLASSFNRLASVNKTEIIKRELVGKVSAVMLTEEGLHNFCHKLLNVLLEMTSSQVGAIFLLNEQKTLFERFESIGLNTTSSTPFSAAGYEGEFGLAVASGKIYVLSDIPADTPMIVSTTTGTFKPREIISMPVKSGDETVAILSLASMHTYTPEIFQIINDLHNTLTARFNGVVARQKILDFSERLEVQNRELDERASELAIQGNELTEQNVELEMQKHQLDQANRLKSSFLSNMSHELRTPLNSVIALSGVLGRRLAGIIPEEEASFIEIIERNGKNLLLLINDVLDLSRIEAGKEDVNIAPFSVYNLLDEVLTILMQQAKDKKIDLQNKAPKGLPLISSDYVKCRHILQNILSNAIKFTETGSVEVNAKVLGSDLMISVKDTGIGISQKDLPFIFDEFRQAEEGASRRFGGTGLGLAISKKFAALLQGEINVESIKGVGSTFTLILPIKPDVQNTLPDNASGFKPAFNKEISRDLPPDAGTGKIILLVEDSEPSIIQIREILAGQNYTVIIARSGKEALEQIGSVIPDAMILDLMMPEVDGFQVLKMIREKPETSKVPVLILTAKHITKEELSFLKGNNIHQFVQKGDVSRTELLSKVNNMVNPNPKQLSKRKPPMQGRIRSGKAMILVVEDNPDNMKTVKALLQKDYKVLEAVDGQEGVNMALKHKPDLILMDMSLPVMDGYSAFTEIRKVEALNDTPVIALTASAMKGSREEILESGFDDYIAKPIDVPLFNRVLKYYLHGGNDPSEES